MTNQDSDLLRRVLAQIASQRRNLQQEPEETDAVRFHEQLDRLSRAGYDVEEFHLRRDRDMYRRWAGSSGWGPDAVHHFADTYTIQPGVLEAQMDAVLTYFRLAGEELTIEFLMPRTR